MHDDLMDLLERAPSLAVDEPLLIDGQCADSSPVARPNYFAIS